MIELSNMMNSFGALLDRQMETELIDAIVALDWSADVLARPVSIVQSRLGLAEASAIVLVLSFQERNLIDCESERRLTTTTDERTRAPKGRWFKLTDRPDGLCIRNDNRN
jgi:hypothetical protein